MRTAGIIAEFNPFHNGHQYLIDQARNVYGADQIVVIMSGDFVQRGGPAAIDKYSRCRMALACGADLVLELPGPGALSSAEGFAGSAVSILDSLGIVDMLIFGCEDPDIESLQIIASILNDEPELYRNTLQESLRSGKNFPSARELALLACLPDVSKHSMIPEMIRKPNNILAIEYCRSLAKTGSSIQPVPVRRIGRGYHDASEEGSILSASAIRAAVMNKDTAGALSGKDFTALINRTIPPAAAAILTESVQQGGFLDDRDFSNLIFYALLEKKGNLDAYTDVSPQLADRLENAAFRTSSLQELVEAVSARSYTQTRIRRCLFHILLGHTSEVMAAWKGSGYKSYFNVLGFRKDSGKIFSSVPEQVRQHMILRSADRRALAGTAAKLSEIDLFASELYRSVYSGKYGIQRQPILSEPVLVF